MTNARVCRCWVAAIGAVVVMPALSGCGFAQPTQPPSMSAEGHVYTTTTSKARSSSSSAPTTPTPRAAVEQYAKAYIKRTASSAEVVSVSLGSHSARDSWVVVADEQTRDSSAYPNLAREVEVVYAHVTRGLGGWVVTSWEPQTSGL